MRRLWLILLFSITCKAAFAQGASCEEAQVLTQISSYCSGAVEYATSKDMPNGWFKFTAVKPSVNITITAGTLTAPRLNVILNCQGEGVSGTTSTTATTVTYDRSGLIIGQEYYIRITGASPGTFQLCINNYNAFVVAGQDCVTGKFLYNMQGFTQTIAAGSGNDPDEAKGTCLGFPGSLSESNSAWYKWRAANNGTLVFTINPQKPTDDIDFALYDLGTSDDCSKVTAANVIRCSAGHGVDNRTCPTEPMYYKVGLDFNETDLAEETGCGSGQNGKLRYVDMEAGHYYALLINNFTSGGNSFQIDFTDQSGAVGTGTFTGPDALLTYTVDADVCSDKPKYTFYNQSTNYTSLKWTFGSGASMATATGPGPYQITYNSPGIRTVTLEASDNDGNLDVDYQMIGITGKPLKPKLSFNKKQYCFGDTIKLTVNNQSGLTYHWTGPNNFTYEGPVANIVVNSVAVNGVYKVYAANATCMSDVAEITVPTVLEAPIAGFTSTPLLPAQLTIPAKVQFINQSVNTTHYYWDFGDGASSLESNPEHEYIKKGLCKVKLIAYQANGCSIATIQGDYEIQEGVVLLIPNTFTPNGDGVNDKFVVTLGSIKTYQMQVYNRWGNLLFESRSMDNSWNGAVNGVPVPAGVYYYVIHAFDYSDRSVNRSGHITVIR